MEKFPNQASPNIKNFVFRDFVREKMHEYSDFMSPIIDRIDEADMLYIGNAFLLNDDYQEGYLYATDVLSRALSIATPDVKFDLVPEFSTTAATSPAAYDAKTNVMHIRLTKDGSEKEHSVVGSIKRLSHELWHAHQRNEIDKSGPRAEIYRDNFRHYVRGEDDLEAYFKQPVEAEAYAFSNLFTNKLAEVYKQHLKREQDKLLGEIAMYGRLDDDDLEYKQKIDAGLDKLSTFLGQSPSLDIHGN